MLKLDGELTLADYMKDTLSGEVPIGRMITEFDSALSLSSDLPMRVASGRDEDKGTFTEGWEYNKSSHLSDIDSGAKASKIGSYSRVDTMQMREGAITYTRKQAEYTGSGNFAEEKYRQTREKLKNMVLDEEKDFFYGDPSVDIRQTMGLYPRYSVLTDVDGVVKAGTNVGKVSPYVTLDAGGTSSGSLTSVFVLVPGARDGVTKIYPNIPGFTGGVKFSEGSWERTMITNDAGEQEWLDMATDLCSLVGGLAINNRHACVRIANVDGSSDTGLKALEKALYDAFVVIPSDLQSRAIIYCSKYLVPKLKVYYNNKVSAVTFEGAKPHNITGMFNIPGIGDFRPTAQITMGESKVS